jgi:hypothetical protein
MHVAAAAAAAAAAAVTAAAANFLSSFYHQIVEVPWATFMDGDHGPDLGAWFDFYGRLGAGAKAGAGAGARARAEAIAQMEASMNALR